MAEMGQLHWEQDFRELEHWLDYEADLVLQPTDRSVHRIV
jgi:hypothetical protein